MQTAVARSVIGTVIALGSAGIIEAQGAMGPADLAALDRGRQVVREERDTRSAWPRVTIRQFIAASPSQSAAVFADYARHATYLPGLKRASIVKQVSSTVAEVDVPLFPDEWYTVRDSISRSDDGASYRDGVASGEPLACRCGKLPAHRPYFLSAARRRSCGRA